MNTKEPIKKKMKITPVTLDPTTIKIISEVAANRFEGNFSMAVRAVAREWAELQRKTK